MSDYFCIPAEMKARAQWMAYKLAPKVPPDPSGKLDKKPYDALMGELADYTDCRHWCTYADALAAVQSGAFDGLAYVFSADDPYTGIDLDHSRDKTTGELAAWAQDYGRRLDSYMEVSISETGVHVIVKAKLPPGGRKRGDVEMYDEKRFFAMTGMHVMGTPVTIEERQAEVEALHTEVFGPQPERDRDRVAATPGASCTLSDDEMLALAFGAKNGPKVEALYRGDTSGYPSASEADYALISAFAFYSQDADQLERLMRGSNLYRAKWDKRNGQYASTLRRNVETLLERDRASGRDTYTPRHNGRHPESDPSPESPEDDSRNAENATNVSQAAEPFSAFSEYVSTPPGNMPAPDPAMFYGVAGDIVAAIAPKSEASPVALLVQMLVCAGNVAGRTRYMQVEATRHYPNLFALLVGRTSRARKGTSWDHVERVFHVIAPDWLELHVVTGLSSGEGIIHCLRDVAEGEDIGPGEVLRRDKRLLALEGEFASVLKQPARTGNILSQILRHGWDGVRIATLTKNSPEKATHTHISVQGHITQAELVACMTTTDVKNGYANRFLFVATERVRLLPFGGDLDAIDKALTPHLARLKRALEWVRANPGQAAFDESARAIWPAEYARLNEEHPGLFGDVTDRGAAHVLRLALLYAILDQSPTVSADHLRAALALWRFCESSARYIFGDRLGDATADSILEALRATPDGMTRTELYDHFGHNVSSAKIGAALAALKSADLAYMVKEPTGEKGRTPERWKAKQATQHTQENGKAA